ncbi:MAG: hypothetical protein JWO84_81 [Parcubacteria group bacterium]|nr:hypothetical protein [Parcubacteria group bacterium]
MFDLTPKELATLQGLSTPARIQDFLDTIPMNHEKRGETCLSPRQVLAQHKAHCLEGALLAATALWVAGERPLLIELKAHARDQDHALALYRRNGYWGAISKTNHATVRFRDPVYRTIHELALSYFHEYFLNTTGQKTLLSYTRPFSLRKFGSAWITSKKDLWNIAYALHDALHFPLVPEENKRYLRPADRMERKAGKIIEWPKSDSRT